MFYKMQRKSAKLDNEEMEEILKSGRFGTLSTMGKNGYPYSTPLNYVYELDHVIYFHSALKGHKLENIKFCERASFSVVTEEEIVAKNFDCHYKSAVVFGKARIVQDEKEKLFALRTLVQKYAPKYVIEAEKYIKGMIDKTEIIALEITHKTAKGSTGNGDSITE